MLVSRLASGPRVQKRGNWSGGCYFDGDAVWIGSTTRRGREDKMRDQVSLGAREGEEGIGTRQVKQAGRRDGGGSGKRRKRRGRKREGKLSRSRSSRLSGRLTGSCEGPKYRMQVYCTSHHTTAYTTLLLALPPIQSQNSPLVPQPCRWVCAKPLRRAYLARCFWS